ncbi:SRPBCC family protein [Mycobacteroides chelonae]|uniref:SRPBCC family protein n=1 Tax=Mycobacteroides chelonae TaxID=1774 RepID=A0A1S1M465_MYCCH|nr:SRPBCC family protein [Mycobacteroides chelonae]OHU78202.1 hypothetical protein BKG84_07165 [Mycobacteroides chelonae]QQG86613.1 SRPBCC family protein [Mycobacteroides chelonae]QQG91430.1 SRPBCC family protein [Mycobacteroides chelonae]
MFEGEASIDIRASAEAVYDIVADVSNTGKLSPEARKVQWINKPEGTLVGARFRGRNRSRGVIWGRTGTVTRADRGRVFTFVIEPGRGMYNDSTTWQYDFEPLNDNSVRVTESFIFHGPRWLELIWIGLGRPKEVRKGLRITLDNLKRVAEAH